MDAGGTSENTPARVSTAHECACQRSCRSAPDAVSCGEVPVEVCGFGPLPRCTDACRQRLQHRQQLFPPLILQSHARTKVRQDHAAASHLDRVVRQLRKIHGQSLISSLGACAAAAACRYDGKAHNTSHCLAESGGATADEVKNCECSLECVSHLCCSFRQRGHTPPRQQSQRQPLAEHCGEGAARAARELRRKCGRCHAAFNAWRVRRSCRAGAPATQQ